MKKLFILFFLLYSINVHSQKILLSKVGHRTGSLSGKKLTVNADSVKVVKPIDSVLNTDIADTSTADSSSTDDCKLNKIASISFKKEDNNKYSLIFEDDKGELVAYFTIEQLNRALFNDKFKKTIESLCNNADSVKDFIARYNLDSPEKGNDLYTKFLEEKENLENPNEKAGTIIIQKRITVFSKDDKKAPAFANNISLIKAEAQKSMAAATKLMDQLNKLATSAKQNVKNNADSIMAEVITKMYTDVKIKVDSAQKYFDSVSAQLPDNKIIEYYNKAKSLSRQAQEDYSNAIKKINDANNKFKDIKDGRIIFRLEPNDELNSIKLNTVNKNHHGGTASVNNISIIPSSLFYLTKMDQLAFDNDKDTGVGAPSSGSGQLSGKFGNFTVYELQIQFQDGFIENIRVSGKKDGNNHMMKFENAYPIGFSTKRDFKVLVYKLLFEKSDDENYNNLSIRLGDVISYVPELANYNKDYSPANQVLTVDKIVDSTKEIVLFKEQTFKILEAKVFSDLKGADNNNPNGLIQVELSKRLNFWSWRHRLWNWGNWGLFNFITPSFSINKIEDNQKRLVLSHIDTLTVAADSSKALTYASTINLLKHQVYNVGFDLSLVLFDIPGIKSTFNFGAGVYFGRTALQDTLRTKTNDGPNHYTFTPIATNNVVNLGVNTFQWGPFFTWQIFPDKRFGVSATQRFTWVKALSNEFEQVRDSVHYLQFIAATDKNLLRQTPYPYFDYKKREDIFSQNLVRPFSLFTKCIATSEIFAYFNPNSNGSNKLFFRYRLNWDVANSRENYHQLQVGFSTYISSTKEFDNLKKNSNF